MQKKNIDRTHGETSRTNFSSLLKIKYNIKPGNNKIKPEYLWDEGFMFHSFSFSEHL